MQCNSSVSAKQYMYDSIQSAPLTKKTCQIYDSLEIPVMGNSAKSDEYPYFRSFENADITSIHW